MVHIREVTFLSKEALSAVAVGGVPALAAVSQSQHHLSAKGAGASGEARMVLTTNLPSPLAYFPSSVTRLLPSPGPEAAVPGSCISRSVWVSAFCSCRARVWVP